LRQTRSLASDDLSHLLQKPEKAADAALSRLIEAGLIETRGPMTGRAWQLSRAAYRPSGEKPIHVPKRGFGPRQQEQMVLKHVEMHGRITRREAAELCRITGPQAYRLLYRLSKHGLVQRDGQRGRNVSYGLTQNQAPQTHGTTR
jgi:ATP-dependent DNA helicase RecG